MTGPEFKQIRKSLGLSGFQMGRALGYTGNHQTVKNQIHRYETGGRDIAPWITRLMIMYHRHGIPPEFTSDR